MFEQGCFDDLRRFFEEIDPNLVRAYGPLSS